MTRSGEVDVKVKGRPIWAEVHERALEANLRAMRIHLDRTTTATVAPGENNSHKSHKRVRILAVVKGDAYGHGAIGAAKAFARAGVDWFGVTCSAEGAELRESGIRKPILVLTGFWDDEEDRLVKHNLTPAISNCRQLVRLERAAARAAKNGRGPVGIHLKIDTGMHRLGIMPETIECVATTLAECPNLRLTGTFTHLASSEDFTSCQTSEQEQIFLNVLSRMRERRLSPGLVHMANSSAAILRSNTWMDMVRLGTALYGYHQNYRPVEMLNEATARVHLQPALSFKARVISLKDVPTGGDVGYNARFRASRPVRIAVLAGGYADGVPRRLADSGKVILRGRFAPLVGVVSMDLTTIDVTDIPDCRTGDIATVYGVETARPDADDTNEAVTQNASDVARLLGTRTSDVLCRLGKRVPRVYVR